MQYIELSSANCAVGVASNHTVGYCKLSYLLRLTSFMSARVVGNGGFAVQMDMSLYNATIRS